MKVVEGLNYREWQKRNKHCFEALTNKDKKFLREKGYRNLGWQSVIRSWKLLQTHFPKLLSQQGDSDQTVVDLTRYLQNRNNLATSSQPKETPNKVTALHEQRLARGDLSEAINESIALVDHTIAYGNSVLAEVEEKQRKVDRKVDSVLNNYPLL